VRTLLERIAHRGIDYELDIEAGYLQRLVEVYARYFSRFDTAPLLIVDALRIDLVHSRADYDRLLSMLDSTRSGRQFLTPPLV